MRRQHLPLRRFLLARPRCPLAIPPRPPQQARRQAARRSRGTAPPQPAGARRPSRLDRRLPSLAERRAVRMLVVYSKTFYFIDKGQQRGITYDMGMELEKHLNANNKDKTRPIRVVFIPVARDQLLPALAAGAGDIATGGLTDHPRTQQAGRLRRARRRRTSARSWSPRRT